MVELLHNFSRHKDELVLDQIVQDLLMYLLIKENPSTDSPLYLLK